MTEPARQWRLLETGPGSGAFNMALDEALLRSMRPGHDRPLLRLYRWSRPTVSVGCNCRLERELDRERCRERGLELVRRPTGGRAVYHGRELTYSVIGPGDTAWLGQTVSESFRIIAGAIRRALESLGVRAELAGAPPEPGGQPGDPLRQPCFAGAARYELAFHGRKLLGSAQRRLGLGAGSLLLEQGSLLLENDQPRLAELMPGASGEAARQKMRDCLERRVIGLSAAAGRTIGYQEAAEAFRRGFAEHFGCSFEQDEPGREELELARELERGRYADERRPADREALLPPHRRAD